MKKVLITLLVLFGMNIIYGQNYYRTFDETKIEQFSGMIPYSNSIIPQSSHIVYGFKEDSIVLNFTNSNGDILETHKISSIASIGEFIGEVDQVLIDKFDNNILWIIFKHIDETTALYVGESGLSKYNVVSKSYQKMELDNIRADYFGQIYQESANTFLFSSSTTRMQNGNHQFTASTAVLGAVSVNHNKHIFEQNLNNGNVMVAEKDIFEVTLNEKKMYTLLNSPNQTGFFSYNYLTSSAISHVAYDLDLDYNSADFIKEGLSFVFLGTSPDGFGIRLFKTDLNGIPFDAFGGGLNCIDYRDPVNPQVVSQKLTAKKILRYNNEYICFVQKERTSFGFGGIVADEIYMLRIDANTGALLPSSKVIENEDGSIFRNAYIENDELFIFCDQKEFIITSKTPAIHKYNLLNENDICGFLPLTLNESNSAIISFLRTYTEDFGIISNIPIFSGNGIIKDLIATDVCSPCDIIVSNLHVNTEACFGEENGCIKFGVDVLSTPVSASYNWSITNGLISMSGTFVPGGVEQVCNLGVGTYDLIIDNNAGCSETFTITMTEFPETPIFLSQTKINLCCREDFDLNDALPSNFSSNFVSWEWFFGTPSSPLNPPIGGNNIPAEVEGNCGLNSAQYTLVAVDLNGCESIATFDVTNIPGIKLDFDVVNETCSNSNGEIYFETIDEIYSTYILNYNLVVTDYSSTVIFTNNGVTPTNINQTISNLSSANSPYQITIDYSIKIGPQETANCSRTIEVNIENDESDCCFANDETIFTNFINIHGNTISTNLTLSGKYFISGDVKFSGDITIDITNCDLVFDKCAGFYFEERAQIRANNSVFRTCDKNTTWKGIKFNKSQEGIINECTFKNAEMALHIQENSSLKINSNSFINNYISIRFFKNESDYAIANNNISIDNDYPSSFCEGVLGDNPYGIRVDESKLRGHVFHNSFINNLINTGYGFVGIGVFGDSEINFSENILTDLTHAIEIAKNDNGAVRIENNEIETNYPINSNRAQIVVSSCDLADVSILGNEVKSYSESISNHYGIYVLYSTDVNIANNTIEGFQYGIYSVKSHLININDNLIENATQTGIYVEKNKMVNIGCNSIFMENYNSKGIEIVNVSEFKIISNCIFDTEIAVALISGGPLGPETVVRNNYFYNYTKVGVFNDSYSNLNLGNSSLSQMGQNSFISNSQADDVITNVPMFAYSNFGLQIFQGPLTINGINNIHSTSNCGQQVISYQSQISLDSSLDCQPDDYYLQKLSKAKIANLSSIEKVNIAIVEYFHYLNANELAFANEYKNDLLNNIVLNDVEKQLFQFEMANRLKDYSTAQTILNSIQVNGVIMQDYISIAQILVNDKLGLIDVSNLSISEIANLERISFEEYPFRDEARMVLISNLNKGVIPIASLEFRFLNIEKVNSISLENNFLTLQPNPATNNLTIGFNVKEEGEKVIQIFDVTGKLVISKSNNFISSSMNIDISKLSKGLYNIRVKGFESDQLVQKFIKI